MTIFQYADYRVYIRDHFENLPSNGRGQINKMAKFLGVNSTLVSQILTYRRDFSLEQAEQLTEFFGLTPLESDYFILLVEKERAGTQRLKKYFSTKIQKVREQSQEIKNRVPEGHVLTDTERAIFYSSWIYQAIRTYCSLDKGKTIEEICEQFNLPRNRATEFLNFLVQTNLCVLKGAIYKPGPQRTHLEAGSPFLPKHHTNWRIRAIQRSEQLESSELMFTAPMSISLKQFELLREDIMKVVQNVYSRVAEDDPEKMACVNLDLFWINK